MTLLNDFYFILFSKSSEFTCYSLKSILIPLQVDLNLLVSKLY